MFFYDFVPFSLAKEMDEKRAAALGYPPSSVSKDDRQLYGDGATVSSLSSTTEGIETQQSSSTQWQQTQSEDNEGQYDFVPHFQRVSIGGEHNSGVIIMTINNNIIIKISISVFDLI